MGILDLATVAGKICRINKLVSKNELTRLEHQGNVLNLLFVVSWKDEFLGPKPRITSKL